MRLGIPFELFIPRSRWTARYNVGRAALTLLQYFSFAVPKGSSMISIGGCELEASPASPTLPRIDLTSDRH